MALCLVFVSFFGGRLSKTELPRFPKILHIYEQKLMWGKSDADHDILETCDAGLEMTITDPGKYAFCMNGKKEKIPIGGVVMDNVYFGSQEDYENRKMHWDIDKL